MAFGGEDQTGSRMPTVSAMVAPDAMVSRMWKTHMSDKAEELRSMKSALDGRMESFWRRWNAKYLF